MPLFRHATAVVRKLWLEPSLVSRVLNGGAGESGSSHEVDDFGIGTMIFAVGIGIFARISLHHLLHLPYTVVLLLIGLVVGVLLHEAPNALNNFGVSLDKWTEVSPEVILFVFLPILIFESAYNTDVHIFQREFWQVLVLAVPGVILMTILTACIVKYWLPYNWSWDTSLMFGSMLSATDPIAVVALLKELGVSERLAVLIEGESLLNDGTAIVLFSVFRDALIGAADSDPATVIKTAARLSLGGPLVGAVLGMAGSFCLGYIMDDGQSEITVTVIVCFTSFLIAEATALHVSGVLAVVTTGLVMSFYARGRISPGVEDSLNTFWSVTSYFANTIIFFISGLIIGDRAIFADAIRGQEWLFLLMLYVGIQLVRAVNVIVCSPFLIMGGYGMDWKSLAVLAFAGLRGAVGLTLALIVAEDDDIDRVTRERILFYMAGIAALTLVVNGTLTKPLLHYLEMDRSSSAETEIFIRACSVIESKLDHQIDLLKGDRFVGDADWEIVWRYVPCMTAKSYWQRIRNGSIKLSAEEQNDLLRGGSSRAEQERAKKSAWEWVCYSLHKWWDQRRGGEGYLNLPYRLRTSWYKYHCSFRLGPSADVSTEVELHQIQNEPQTAFFEDAWASGALKANGSPSNSTATSSSSLRTLEGGGAGGGSKNMKVEESEAYRTQEEIKRLRAIREKARQGLHQAELKLKGSEMRRSVEAARQEERQAFHQERMVTRENAKGFKRNLSHNSVHNIPQSLSTSTDGGSHRRSLLGNISQHGSRRKVDHSSRHGLSSRSRHGSLFGRKGSLVGPVGSMSVHAGMTGMGVECPTVERTGVMGSDERDTTGNSAEYPTSPNSATSGGGLSILNAIGDDAEDEARLLAEAHIRFLTAVKAKYQERYQKGWLSSSGLRVMSENIDSQLDHEEADLREWERLSESFQLPAERLASLSKVPFLGALIVEPYVYWRLAFLFELASTFISAHEDVDILELIKEGPVAYQLAYEKTRQINLARTTLAEHLPALPELARSLKTQVASRYILVQHRELVEEMYLQGHIHEKEHEALIHQNNAKRIKLDYHPHADQIPGRRQLLQNVPFLRFLTEEERDAVIFNNSACVEKFYGSNTVLMQGGATGGGTPAKHNGWFVVVRGSVRQVTESKSTSSTRGALPTIKEKLVHSGMVFGLDDQLLDVPYSSTYMTSSFVHVFFFDKAHCMTLAEKYPALKRGLWWSLAVSVVRNHRGFRRMTPKDITLVMKGAEFIEFSSKGRVHHEDSPRVPPRPVTAPRGSFSSSLAKQAVEGSSARPLSQRSKRRHSLEIGISLSRSKLDPEGSSQPGSPKYIRYELVKGAQILLLKGSMRQRPPREGEPAVPAATGVAVIQNAAGPLDFTVGTVMFLLPAVLLARSSSSHQVLMEAIQKTAKKAKGGAQRKGSAQLVAPTRKEVLAAMDDLEREVRLEDIDLRQEDVGHKMDQVRRKRTLRDAEMARKAREPGEGAAMSEAKTMSYAARRKGGAFGGQTFEMIPTHPPLARQGSIDYNIVTSPIHQEFIISPAHHDFDEAKVSEENAALRREFVPAEFGEDKEEETGMDGEDEVARDANGVFF